MTRTEFMALSTELGFHNLAAMIPNSLIDAICAWEREECAKVCDGWPDYDVEGLADAIRARRRK